MKIAKGGGILPVQEKTGAGLLAASIKAPLLPIFAWFLMPVSVAGNHKEAF